jgi:hypothetical protein
MCEGIKEYFEIAQKITNSEADIRTSGPPVTKQSGNHDTEMVLLYTLVQWLKGLGVMSPTQHRKKQME